MGTPQANQSGRYRLRPLQNPDYALFDCITQTISKHARLPDAVCLREAIELPGRQFGTEFHRVSHYTWSQTCNSMLASVCDLAPFGSRPRNGSRRDRKWFDQIACSANSLSIALGMTVDQFKEKTGYVTNAINQLQF